MIPMTNLDVNSGFVPVFSLTVGGRIQTIDDIVNGHGRVLNVKEKKPGINV
jgi:hypothetical protein